MKSEELIEILNSKNAIPFGSRVFEVETFNSDYDYLVDKDTYQHLFDVLLQEGNLKGTHNVTISDYYEKSFYYDTEDLKTFNIVTYKNSDKKAWEAAIAMLKAIPKDMISLKDKRCLLFETILALLKHSQY
jgi:predicted nucleotidyltransferase